MKGRTTRSRKHSGSQGGGRGEHGATLRFGVGGAGHTVRTRMLAVALRVCAGQPSDPDASGPLLGTYRTQSCLCLPQATPRPVPAPGSRVRDAASPNSAPPTPDRQSLPPAGHRPLRGDVPRDIWREPALLHLIQPGKQVLAALL